MKKIFINIAIASAVLFIAGCEKDRDYKASFDMTDPTDALLKINYLSLYTANPSVQLSINGARVSGLITGRTPFPGGGYNTNGSNFPDYLAVKPGTNVLTIAIPKRFTNVDSVLLFTGNMSLEANKNYTAHVTDTFTRTKMVVVEDSLFEPHPGYSRYRFYNMMPTVPFIDLYYGNDKVAGNIPYLGKSVYFDVQNLLPTLTWSIRETGTSPTSTALATYLSANTAVSQRIYSAFALGYKGQTATTLRPYISFLLNK